MRSTSCNLNPSSKGIAPILENTHWLDFEDMTSGRIRNALLQTEGKMPHRHANESRTGTAIWRGRRGILTELAAALPPLVVEEVGPSRCPLRARLDPCV